MIQGVITTTKQRLILRNVTKCKKPSELNVTHFQIERLSLSLSEQKRVHTYKVWNLNNFSLASFKFNINGSH